jgi:hypothetical protein
MPAPWCQATISSQKHLSNNWEGGFRALIGRLHNLEERSVDWHNAEARRSKVQWNSHGELVTPNWSWKVERARVDGHCYRFVSEFPNVFVEMNRISNQAGTWCLEASRNIGKTAASIRGRRSANRCRVDGMSVHALLQTTILDGNAL